MHYDSYRLAICAGHRYQASMKAMQFTVAEISAITIPSQIPSLHEGYAIASNLLTRFINFCHRYQASMKAMQYRGIKHSVPTIMSHRYQASMKAMQLIIRQ